MNNRNKLKLSCIIYSLFLSIVIIIVFYFQSYDKYFRWGIPDSNKEPLVVLSVKIDNYYKYACVLGLIAGIKIIKVGVSDITDPILSFTKNELQFYANFLYLIDNIRYVFTLMITITQIDLALFSVLIGELTSLFTIRMLLNEKTFNNIEYNELII